MANHVSAEEAALRQIEKLSAQVAQEVGPPSPSWATAARAERDSADGGARDRQVTAQVEGDGTSARAPSPDRSRCSNALEGARAPKELHRVEEVEKDGGGVRGVVAFQVASPGAAPRLSRNVLLVAGKGVVRIEELDTPHTELLRLPLVDVQVTLVPGHINAFDITVHEAGSTDSVTVVLPTSEERDRWLDALGRLGVPVPHGWRPLSEILDDGIPCALNGQPPPTDSLSLSRREVDLHGEQDEGEATELEYSSAHREGAAAVRRGRPRPGFFEGPCGPHHLRVVAAAAGSVSVAVWYSRASALVTEFDTVAGTLMIAVCTWLGVYAGEHCF